MPWPAVCYCLRSVSMVGSLAATGYGAHVAGEMAADLGERGWAVVSGGPYGIDVRAHEVGLPKRADHPTRARPFGIRSATASHAERRLGERSPRPPTSLIVTAG